MKTTYRLSYSIMLNLLIFISLFLGLANIQAQVTIDGNVTIDGQTDHSGIMVVFERTNPTFAYDTTYTDAAGNYSKLTNDGMVNILFSKDCLIKPDTLYALNAYADLTAPNVVLDSTLHDTIIGTLTAGTYYIGCDLIVPVGDSLIIQPGVTMLFYNDAKIDVYGKLKAVGTQADSITFSRLNETSTWASLNIKSNSIDNKIEYCKFLNHTSSHTLSLTYNSELFIKNTLFKDIQNSIYNPVIYAGGGSLIIDNSTFINNETDIFEYGSNISIKNSNFHNNSVVVLSYFDQGILLENCILKNNVTLFQTLPSGAGSTTFNLTIVNSLLFNNDNVFYTSDNNDNFNIDLSSTLIKNNNNIFSINENTSLFSFNDNIFHNNTNLGTNYPTNLGTLSTVNANGDSTDTYGNLFIDPELIDPANGDFHLNPFSPCIDAGDNLSVNTSTDFEGNARVFDGNYDSTLTVDIGPYEFSQAFVEQHDLTIQIWQAPLNSQGYYSAAEQLTVQIKNNGTVADSNFIVSYSINNGTTWITDTFNNVLGAYNTASFSFTQTANLHTPGTYNCLVAVSVPNDNDTSNDTLAITLQSNSYNKIDGYATIQGETDHAGIRVIFKQTSPSNSQDTVYTASNGYYEFYGSQGNYEVYFIKPCGSTPDTLYNQSCFNTLNTLSSVSLFKTLSGNLSGTLAQGTYYIGCDVTVPAGDSLIIEPGTEMLFFHSSELIVEGKLLAIGTQQDSIIFERAFSNSGWDGLLFYNTRENNTLSYTVIKGSIENGIALYYSDINILNSNISNNSGDGEDFNMGNTGGGAIKSKGGNKIIIDNCYIYNNIADFRGVFLFDDASNINLKLSNSRISENTGTLFQNFSNSQINIEITNCVIENNDDVFQGGYKLIKNCYIRSNNNVFGSITQYSFTGKIHNVVVANNAGNIIAGRISSMDVELRNSLIINNTGSVFSHTAENSNHFNIDAKNTIFANNGADVFNLPGTNETIIINNSLFSTNANLGTNYPDSLGILTTQNPNGDSTDTYGNLFMDPQLVDTANGDFHLSYGSPAIDAGNNLYINSTTDFDGNQRVLDGNGDNNNVVDIGPYEYQFTQVLTDIGVLSLSTSSPCAGVQDIKAIIRNFGQDTIHSFSIALKINDTLQNTFSWQGALTSGDTINVVLDSIFNPYNSQTYNLLAYPILVNSISDTVTINDTASLSKTYLIPSSLSFPNIGSVCIDSSIVNIDIATPSGGIYTGAGVQQNSFYPSQIGAGVHQINYIYTDSNQCVNIINSSITVLDLPQISFSSINPINYCQDGSKSILSAIPSGGVFSGATTDSVFYADSLNTGINQITYKYTDANSCSNIDTLSIEVFDLPNVSLGTQANVCESQNSIILTGGSPASGYYTGKGVDSAQSKLYIDSVGVGLSEIFYNYIDNHSCMNSDTQNIRVVGVPNASFSIAPTVCKNDTVDVNCTANASINAIFNWNFDSANVYSGGTSDSVQLSWNTPGIKLISLNITDSLCTSSNVYNYTNVLESVSIASIAGNDSACFGDSILLTAYQNGSNSFQWLDSLQQPISTAINQNYFAKNSGEYYLKTSNSIGCSDISSPLTIYINPYIISDFTLASQACKNSMVNIQYNGTTSANAYYNWNFDGGAIGSGSNSGPYNIIWNSDSIKNVSLYVQENNCTSDLSTKSIEITSPLAEITPLSNTTICNGENVGLSANYGNFSYNWFKDGISLQDTSAVFYATQSGQYFLEVTDLSNLCTNNSDSVSVTVNSTDFNLAFSVNQLSFNIPPFNVNFINQTPNNTDYFFNWDLGDGTTSNYISPSHQYAYDGDYDVSLVAQNILSGCYDTLYKIDYIHCDGGTPDPCSLNNKIGNSSGHYVCPGDSIKLFSKEHGVGVNYQWLKGGVIISNAIDSVYYATETGLYQLMVSDTNCTKFSQPYPITKRTVITPIILANGSLQYCSNDSLELYVNSTYANYQWSNGATSQSIFVNTSSNYIVTVIDNNSCQIVSAPYTLNTAIVPAPQICIVGIDTATNHNRIVWERNNSTLIDSFRIYRESSVSGVYNLIGNQPFSTPGLFQDINSNPAQQAYSYKISAIDTCGMESPLSIMHKTIHLTINSGLGGVWNLIWNHYQGFAYNSYRIYRGTDSINMTLLTQIQSSVNSYTDLTPPAGNVYYQIEVVSPHPCYPDSVYSKANTNYNYSRSNTANSNLAPNLGFATALQGNLSLTLYPNPNKGQFTLELNSNTSQMQTYQLEVYSVLGKLIHSETLSFGSKLRKEMHFENLSKGVYFVRLRSKDNVLMSRFIVE